MKYLNEVVCKDNLELLKELPSQSIDLVYIDPPFFTQRNFKNKEGVGFDDKWDCKYHYIQWIQERVIEIERILKDTGSIFLHCDWRTSHYMRFMLDDVFGENNFVNEVIWSYLDVGMRNTNSYKKCHNSIHWYAKDKKRYKSNAIAKRPLSESTLRVFKKHFDDNGQITFRRLEKTNPGHFAGLGKRIPKNLDTVCYDKNKGTNMTDVWVDIKPIRKKGQRKKFKEPLRYPTQKPESLLQRIIETVTFEGDTVADFFCGSGTTLAVAKRLGRKYIGCDSNPDAVKITRDRLSEILE